MPKLKTLPPTLIATALAALLVGGCGEASSGSASAGSSSVSSARAGTGPSAAAGGPSGTAASPSGASTSPTATTAKPGDSSPAPGAPGTRTQPVKPEEQLGKTPFLAAAGTGFAAFHQYISKPLRKHAFSHGSAVTATRARAATAAALAARELGAAATAAGQSKALARLAAPLLALQRRLTAIGAGLHAGHVDELSIKHARSEVNSISLAAMAAGQPIQEVVPRLP